MQRGSSTACGQLKGRGTLQEAAVALSSSISPVSFSCQAGTLALLALGTP